MSSSVTAFFLALLLLTFYVLLPVIPATIIFKFFPDTQVMASGPLKGLTLKTSGAFSAYLIILLAGEPLVMKTYILITEMVPATWTVHAKVKLLDSDRNPLPGKTSIASMRVSNFDPSLFKPGETDGIQITVPVEVSGKWPTIWLEMPGFNQGQINLSERINNQKVHLNNDKQEIILSEPVMLTAVQRNLTETPYQPPHVDMLPTATLPQLPATPN